jgi:hypothetical protein
MRLEGTRCIGWPTLSECNILKQDKRPARSRSARALRRDVIRRKMDATRARRCRSTRSRTDRQDSAARSSIPTISTSARAARRCGCRQGSDRARPRTAQDRQGAHRTSARDHPTDHRQRRSDTAGTITDPEKLRAALATIRQKGYAIDDEEIEVGLRCIAAPIRDHSGQVTAAISVAAPVQRMTKKNLQATIPSVIAAADAISRRLGYLPSLAGAQMAD